MTPLTRSNTACTPQKQPPETTSVCSPFELANAVSTAGDGTAFGAAPALHAINEPRRNETIADTRTVDDMKSPCMMKFCKSRLPSKRKVAGLNCFVSRQFG